MNDFYTLFDIVVLWEPNFASLSPYHNVMDAKLLLHFGAKFIVSRTKLRCYCGNVFIGENIAHLVFQVTCISFFSLVISKGNQN